MEPLLVQNIRINGRPKSYWTDYDGNETVTSVTYEGTPGKVLEYEWVDGNPDHINVLLHLGLFNDPHYKKPSLSQRVAALLKR